MNADFWNTVRGIVANQLAEMGQARMGTVVSVDPARAAVRVTWDEEGTQSGWLPIAQQAAGNGWGMVTLPVPGTQVYVGTDMGELGHGVVLGAVHSTAQPPGKVTPYGAGSPTPIPIVPGETTLIHTSGASLRLTAGGVEINGNLKVKGNIIASGDIYDENQVHESLDYLRQRYNQHDHLTSVGRPQNLYLTP